MHKRSTTTALILLMTAMVFAACARRAAVTGDTVMAAELAANPGDKRMGQILALIKEAPDSPIGYIQLASLYIRSGRETGRLDHGTKAMASVDRALELDPANVQARKLKATLLL